MAASDGDAPDAAPVEGGRSRWGAEAEAFLGLFFVSGAAVAQPLLDVFGDAPDEFIRRDISGLAVLWWALALLLVPPVAVWAIEVAVGSRWRGVRRVVHGVAVGSGVGAFAVHLAKQVSDWRSLWLLVPVAALAVGAGVAVDRWGGIRRWMVWVSWAPLVALAAFLGSPSADLITADRTVAVPEVTAVGPSDDPESTVEAELLPDDPTAVDAAIVAGTDTPVVVVILDAWPTALLLDGGGAVDRNLFPGMAELADASTWYRNATTVAPFTVKAVPAILTGQLPTPEDEAPIVSNHPENLFTLLGGTHALHVQEFATALCPVNLCPDAPGPVDAGIGGIWDRTLEVYADMLDPAYEPEVGFDVAGEGRLADYYRWLDGIEAGPALHVVHSLMPHEPYNYVASGARYVAPEPPEGMFAFVWTSEAAAMLAQQRFLLQAQAADRQIADLITQLDQQGIWDEALVIVTADHGASFLVDNSTRGLDRDNEEYIAWVPFFVKLPGQSAGAVDDRQVTVLDLVPTVADVLGIEIPWEVDGIPVADERPAGPVTMLDWSFNATSSDGDYVQLDPRLFDEVLAGRAVPAGTIADRYAPFRMGDHGAIVGRRVDEFAEGGPVDGEVAGLELFERVVVDAPVLPLYVRVELAAAAASGGTPPTDIAIAVNGTVGVAAPVVAGRAADAAWVVIPDWLLVDGRNDVQVFAVRGPVAAPTLHPVG